MQQLSNSSAKLTRSTALSTKIPSQLSQKKRDFSIIICKKELWYSCVLINGYHLAVKYNFDLHSDKK